MQGEAAAPDLVKLNFQRWRRLNPNTEFVVLVPGDIERLTQHYPHFADLPVQARSDILRIELLAEGGGVWTDASVFPLCTLDQWLPAALAPIGFFAFSRPEPSLRLSSWFLAAEPQNALLLAWRDLVRLYWSVPREPAFKGREAIILDDPEHQMRPFDLKDPAPFPYFWFHHLFSVLVANDEALAALWHRRTVLPSIDAHALQTLYRRRSRRRRREHAARVLRALFGDRKLQHAVSRTPMQKLDWRASYPLQTLETLSQDFKLPRKA